MRVLDKAVFNVVRSYQLHNRQYNLYSLILFVTNKCNGGCIGCLYWPKLNKKSAVDLSLDEIRKISRSMGNVWHLQISGGEPFLREDLPEICRFFVENNSTRFITIPTNGLLTKKIIHDIQEILVSCKCRIGISVSIDQTQNANYHLRPGSNIKRFKTLEKLCRIQNCHNNLKLAIATRLTNKNYNDARLLANEIRVRFPGINHMLFPIRGRLNANELRRPLPSEYWKCVSELNMGILNNTKRHFIMNLLNNEPWPFGCVAGHKIGVIDSDGDVRLCELLDPIGNLRKASYDFYGIWSSKKANKQRQVIANGECSTGCTHGCFLWPSLLDKPWNTLPFLFRAGKFSP